MKKQGDENEKVSKKIENSSTSTKKFNILTLLRTLIVTLFSIPSAGGGLGGLGGARAIKIPINQTLIGSTQNLSEALTMTPSLAPTPKNTRLSRSLLPINPSQSTTAVPSKEPTKVPTLDPSQSTTKVPTLDPSQSTTKVPTLDPSQSTTEVPTLDPSQSTTEVPTLDPSQAPSFRPLTSGSSSQDQSNDITAHAIAFAAGALITFLINKKIEDGNNNPNAANEVEADTTLNGNNNANPNAANEVEADTTLNGNNNANPNAANEVEADKTLTKLCSKISLAVAGGILAGGVEFIISENLTIQTLTTAASYLAGGAAAEAVKCAYEKYLANNGQLATATNGNQALDNSANSANSAIESQSNVLSDIEQQNPTATSSTSPVFDGTAVDSNATTAATVANNDNEILDTDDIVITMDSEIINYGAIYPPEDDGIATYNNGSSVNNNFDKPESVASKSSNEENRSSFSGKKSEASSDNSPSSSPSSSTNTSLKLVTNSTDNELQRS